MLSDAPVAEASAEPSPESGDRHQGNGVAKGAHSQLAGMLTSLGRLADLQVAIWLASVKRLMVQVIMVSVLSVLALIAALVGVVFLYAGIFHILTDMLHVPTVWALLIFAGAHLALGGGFVVSAVAILNRKTVEKESGVGAEVPAQEIAGDKKTGVAS